MKYELNNDFKNKMKILLKDDFESFIKVYDNEPYRALRVNTLKISVEEFLKISPFSLSSVNWCPTGFYYNNNEKPGSHIYHDLGLYYIQEPSAMAVTEILDPKPGDIVLDLSAAPGGKTSHIATKLNGHGMLVANEINGKRVKILAENIERMGIRNAVILNDSPERLAYKFPAYFDKILVDAPCSGEGMFRKEEATRVEWSKENVISSSLRQKYILESASKMLKCGGTLVYSTCTFSPEEDEGVIKDFLEKHDDYTLLKSNIADEFDEGHPEWVNGEDDLRKCIRLWPHKIKGEGHFIAKLIKEGTKTNIKREYNKENKKLDLDLFYDFVSKYLKLDINHMNLRLIGSHVYHIPGYLPDLNGIRVYKYGVDLGEVKKNRFEPSHWFAMCLNENDIKSVYRLNDFEINKYMHGETLNVDMYDGWTAIFINKYPIGWGRVKNGILKNYYPKRLRR